MMNLRFEAESRVERQRLRKTIQLERQSGGSCRNRRPQYSVDVNELIDGPKNMTPTIAALAETDYSLNGSRARCYSDEFIGPRWILDAESIFCSLCHTEFDWWTRRHHCRHCGRIFCSNCSSYKSLLPHAFGLRDPQRVCQPCHGHLLPQQILLTNNIANHQRVNTVDLISYSLRRYLNFPISFTLGSEIRKAGYTTFNLCRQMFYIRDKTIPLGLLAGAKGLAFITVAKGGFMLAPFIGTGLVVARLPNSEEWSAPSAIGTIGVSYGPLIGAEVIDYMIILNTDDAVSAFASAGQIAVKGSVDIAVGPLGRSTSMDLNFGDGGCAATYTYSHSRGLYAGASLEGSIIISRSDVNHRFYGRVVTPLELLRGEVYPPRAARPLYDALQEATTAMSMPIYGNPPLTLLLSPPSSVSSANKSGTYGTQSPGSVSIRQGQDPLRSFFNSTDSNGLANISYETVYNSHDTVTSSQRFRTASNPYIVQGTS